MVLVPQLWAGVLQLQPVAEKGYKLFPQARGLAFHCRVGGSEENTPSMGLMFHRRVGGSEENTPSMGLMFHRRVGGSEEIPPNMGADVLPPCRRFGKGVPSHAGADTLLTV
jgi:hypothetical protein